MELTLLHVHGKGMGYARYGTFLHEHLERLGVDVYDHLETAESGNYNSALLETGSRQKMTNVVAWVSVPTHARGWYAGQTPIISTMWEAGSLPEAFRENLENFDTVIVPSDQNVELFSRYHPNVKKVPLGVDTDDWCYRPRKAPEHEFRFLIGGSGKRKGTDVAYAAFRKAFPEGSWNGGPTPILVMKQPKPEDFYAPRVRIVSGKLSAAEEIGLYADAHCYLQPSRGEGFGLQPLQAICQGCPTVLTDAHGHADFAEYGWPLSWTWSKADYFIYGDAGQWWEPDVADLVDQMRWIYNNYELACDVAEEESVKARARFTWQNTAVAFLDAVGRDRLETPYAGDGVWVKPEAKLYHVRVHTAWRAEIAGGEYHFVPDVDYWEMADVKRVMFEAGVLDPACLEGATFDGFHSELGLTEKQVAQIGGYKAEHAYCGTCGQKLGTGVTKADEEFARLEAAAHA